MNENTVAANAANIATSDENLSVEQMFHQSTLPSLGRQIFPVIPMHGPTAALFNVRKKVTNNFEIVREEVEVFPSVSVNTGITKEAVQDIIAQFGKSSIKLIGNLFRGIANDEENIKTLEFLENNSKLDAALQLTDSKNAETNLFELTQKANELILRINSKTLRSFKAFCILPYRFGASLSSLKSYVSDDTVRERGLTLAKVNTTTYFMNPDANSTTAYVGIIDLENYSKSSGIFSPYASNISLAINPDTGNESYTLFNRFAITISPLHEANNEMLYKFDILP